MDLKGLIVYIILIYSDINYEGKEIVGNKILVNDILKILYTIYNYNHAYIVLYVLHIIHNK